MKRSKFFWSHAGPVPEDQLNDDERAASSQTGGNPDKNGEQKEAEGEAQPETTSGDPNKTNENPATGEQEDSSPNTEADEIKD